MKIDGSLISAYAAAKLRGAGEESLSTGSGGGNASRNIPTVGPVSAMPKGLANALWLANAKLEKAQDASDSLTFEFMELSKMTPAERIRKEILDQMGLSEDALAQMPEDQRQAVEEEIRRALKERLGLDEQQMAGAPDGQTAAGTKEAEA